MQLFNLRKRIGRDVVIEVSNRKVAVSTIVKVLRTSCSLVVCPACDVLSSLLWFC